MILQSTETRKEVSFRAAFFDPGVYDLVIETQNTRGERLNFKCPYTVAINSPD